MRAAAALLACLAAASAAPCDILPDCVAAHSLLRALYGAYSGPLYSVRRARDNATLDIPLLAPGGLVNASAQDAFCAPAAAAAVPPFNTTVSLRPAALPAYSFRHCDAQGFITPDDGGEDHRFTLVPALSGQPGQVSFRSVNFPAWYLAPIATAEPGRLGIVQAPAAAAASWVLAPAAGGGLELRSAATGQAAVVGSTLTGACAPQYAPPAAGVLLGAPGAQGAAWLLQGPPPPPLCTIETIYDQSGLGNHLRPAPPGGAVNRADLPVDAAAYAVTLSSGGGARAAAYGAYFETRMGYRNDNTTGVAKGDDPETIYSVVAGKVYNSGCCFDYGNAEHNDHDDGAGTMECTYYGSWNAARSGWCGGAGDPALGGWVMADLEDGLWACNASGTVNPRVQPATSDFVVGMVKGGGGDFWAIKSGDGGAGGGALEELWAGPRPRGYFPMRKQGSIILGIGGDNSDSAIGVWFEGVMTASLSSDAQDDALMRDIVGLGLQLA